MKIRKASEKDTESFIEIKNQLSFKNVKGTTTKGGFLLGTDVDTYKKYILNDYVLVAEINEKIVGFGIILKDKTVRNTDIWQKRDTAKWLINIEQYTEKSICYFEQLAFVPGHSRLVMQLCYQIIEVAFKNHIALFTTTVHAPILNLAAVPYILRAGGFKIGNINEHYPNIGNIISDIYIIEKPDYEQHILHSEKYVFLHKKSDV